MPCLLSSEGKKALKPKKEMSETISGNGIESNESSAIISFSHSCGQFCISLLPATYRTTQILCRPAVLEPELFVNMDIKIVFRLFKINAQKFIKSNIQTQEKH